MCLCVCLFRTAPMAYGGSQARGQIGAVTVGPCHGHSNTGSEPHPRNTPQLLNPLSEARDRKCVLMDASQICFCWATSGMPTLAFYIIMLFSINPVQCLSTLQHKHFSQGPDMQVWMIWPGPGVKFSIWWLGCDLWGIPPLMWLLTTLHCW